ncbi:MAG TPA: glycosyltransferase family 39 protein [Acidimicrobiia bacterium]|nr:glycosyltransferase family 39 protein [Acidimicrobiia bacterium]
MLLAIVAVAFGIRVSYVAIAKAGPCRAVDATGKVLASSPSKCLQGDELFYNSEANFIAAGHGFNEPYSAFFHPGRSPQPAADHPPLTVSVLAPVSWLVDRPPLSWVIDEPQHDHVREHRYTMVVLGTVLVGLVGLLGRRLGGDTVGLVAASIAAITPNMWVNDGLVMSETLTALAVVGALLCAFRFWERPTAVRAAALGALCGVAALARVEFGLLAVLLGVVIPLALERPWTERSTFALTAVVAAALVVAPWVGFNLARFREPTFISTNDGITLAGANCEQMYYGSGVGLWTLGSCTGSLDQPGDQSQVSSHYRHRAFDYIDRHKSRVPIVVLARVGRTWSLFRPLDMVAFNAGEDRERWVTRLGLLAYYPTLVCAIAGAVVLWRRRRRVALWVLCAPAVVVTIGAVVTYGQTRFRAPAEPTLALLAAVGIVAVVDHWRGRRAVTDPPAVTP